MTVPSEATSPRPSAPTSELRTRILREATRLFAEKGYAATSVREVVEASGCTKPALYYYFKSKDALFLEAIHAETEASTHIIVQSMPSGDVTTVRAGMKRGLQAYVAHIRQNPMGMRLILRAELQRDEGQPAFDFDSLRTTQLQMIKDMLAHGVATGEIRKDVDLEDAAHAIAGMVEQRTQLWLAGVPMPEDMAERVLRIFFHGVA